MAFIDWNDSYSVSVSQFDEQHKELIGLINKLHEAMMAGKGGDVLAEVLNSLIAYTVTHFSNEEDLMRKYNYPAYEVHKTIHDKLVHDVVDIQNRFKAGKPMLTMELMDFLKKWLTDHINGVDKKYSAFFASSGVV